MEAIIFALTYSIVAVLVCVWIYRDDPEDTWSVFTDCLFLGFMWPVILPIAAQHRYSNKS